MSKKKKKKNQSHLNAIMRWNRKASTLDKTPLILDGYLRNYRIPANSKIDMFHLMGPSGTCFFSKRGMLR